MSADTITISTIALKRSGNHDSMKVLTTDMEEGIIRKYTPELEVYYDYNKLSIHPKFTTRQSMRDL